MFTRAAVAALGLQLLGQVPAVFAALENSTDCVDVHFMVARGTTISYPGFPYDVFETVAANMTATSNYENIIYPAVDETSSDSYFVGVNATGAQVNAYAEKCPDSKIVLGSYSQGALIVGDALVGGGGQTYLGDPTEPLVTEANGQKIIANILFGNPRHIPYEPYDVGSNNPKNATGKYPRLPYQIDNFNRLYTNITQDWCNNGDGVCSPSEGADALSLHVAYDGDYATVAAEWTLQAIGSYAYAK